MSLRICPLRLGFWTSQVLTTVTTCSWPALDQNTHLCSSTCMTACSFLTLWTWSCKHLARLDPGAADPCDYLGHWAFNAPVSEDAYQIYSPVQLAAKIIVEKSSSTTLTCKGSFISGAPARWDRQCAWHVLGMWVWKWLGSSSKHITSVAAATTPSLAGEEVASEAHAPCHPREFSARRWWGVRTTVASEVPSFPPYFCQDHRSIAETMFMRSNAPRSDFEIRTFWPGSNPYSKPWQRLWLHEAWALWAWHFIV